MANLEFRIIKKRCKEVSITLTEAFKKNQRIFEKKDELIPEILLPEGIQPGSKEHANFLFMTNALDGSRKSNRVYKAGRAIFSQHDLKSLVDMTESKLRKILTAHLDNGRDNPSRILKDGARRIIEDYDGDARKIFEEVDGFDQARKNLFEFYGIRKGKSNLIIKNFIKQGFLTFHGQAYYDCCPKIDRWAIRISIGTGILKTKKKDIGKIRTTSLIDPLEKVFRDTCLKYKIDPIILNDAIWLVGSYLCSRKDNYVCSTMCPLECDTLVKMDTGASYVQIPSESRSLQQSLF